MADRHPRRSQRNDWSDVALGVNGQSPLHKALLTLEQPDDGPLASGYVGTTYDLSPHPL